MSIIQPARPSLADRFSSAAWPHPNDPAIWYTHDPRDLRRAFNSAVKAVIWLRNPDIHEEAGRMLLQKAALFGQKLKSDLTAIARADLQAYLPYIRSAVERTGSGEAEYHVDNPFAQKGPFVRFICGLKGTGPRFWAGALPDDLDALIRAKRDDQGRLYTLPTQAPEGVDLEICPQGSVIGFRSHGPGIDPKTLLVHGAPVVTKGERLAYLVHYVL